MTKRNGRVGSASTERDGRPRVDRLKEAKGHPASDGGDEKGHEDPNEDREPVAASEAGTQQGRGEGERDDGDIGCGCQGLGVEQVGPASNAHDLAISLVFTVFTVVMFLGFTNAVAEWLPWRAYLMRAGTVYGLGFASGFLTGLWLTAAVRDWSRPMRVGFECRAALLLIAFGFLGHATVEVTAGPDGRWSAVPLLWAPAILVPAIGLGAVVEGILLGEIASVLPRRTPWHALRCAVSAWRREAAGRKKP